MNDRDDELFIREGDRQIAVLRKLARLSPTSTVLDIGSGYGRLAHALHRDPDFRSRYIGLDVLPRHIAWCQENLATDTFEFALLDVENDRYNPDGADISKARWPVAEHSVDVINIASVFTHMWPEHIQRYLRLSRRALRRGGRGYATFFLMNESWEKLDAQGKPRFSLPYIHSPTCRYHDADKPLYVIAHDQRWVVDEMRDAGLVPVEVVLGSWPGRTGRPVLQDAVAFRRRRRAASLWHVGMQRVTGRRAVVVIA